MRLDSSQVYNKLNMRFKYYRIDYYTKQRMRWSVKNCAICSNRSAEYLSWVDEYGYDHGPIYVHFDQCRYILLIILAMGYRRKAAAE